MISAPGLSSMVSRQSPQAWRFAVLSPLSPFAAAAPFFDFLALGAPPAPTSPMIASGAYFPTTSGGWIILNSSVASLPAKVRIASSPPGWSLKKLVTSNTWPSSTTQHDSLVLCLATSSKVKPPPPPDAAGASDFDTFMASSLTLVSFLEAPAESSERLTGLNMSPSMYWAACLPDTRPNTTQSRRELPPRRLLP